MPAPPQSASVAERLLCSVLPPPLRRPRRAASDAAAAPLLLPRRAIVEDATRARAAILQQQAALAAAATPRPLPRALLLPRRRHRPVGEHSTRVPARGRACGASSKKVPRKFRQGSDKVCGGPVAFAPAFGRRGVASRCVPLLRADYASLGAGGRYRAVCSEHRVNRKVLSTVSTSLPSDCRRCLSHLDCPCVCVFGPGLRPCVSTAEHGRMQLKTSDTETSNAAACVSSRAPFRIRECGARYGEIWGDTRYGEIRECGARF